MDLWKKLGKPKFIVAPMVDASELAWRMLCRNHGAQLCYTPMLHSYVFTKSAKYRNESLATCAQDRPLIVQFCGNDPEILLKAAQMVEGMCDCIDLNLGCPQSIAKRGHYGAFLQDEWKLLSNIIRTLHKNIKTPVSSKIRIFPEISKSVEYARMLESAGCQMLTVHGRTRQQKGPLTGVASWAHIKAIREAVKIPVIANGNIQCLNDIYRCINETGCSAVMSAEGILYNPALFEGTLVPVWEVALEYLHLTDLYPCPLSFIRGHLFKLFQHLFVLPENEDLRLGIGVGKNKEDFLETTLKIKRRFESLHNAEDIWRDDVSEDCNVYLPPWICQPWVRMAPELHIEKMKTLNNRANEKMRIEKENVDAAKREFEDQIETEVISKKRQKRMLRKPKVNPHCRKNYQKCTVCLNPLGLKCVYQLCKRCCRDKCMNEVLDCQGHRIKVATRKEANRLLQSETKQVEL